MENLTENTKPLNGLVEQTDGFVTTTAEETAEYTTTVTEDVKVEVEVVEEQHPHKVGHGSRDFSTKL